jgi:DNA-binding protein YbaB
MATTTWLFLAVLLLTDTTVSALLPPTLSTQNWRAVPYSLPPFSLQGGSRRRAALKSAAPLPFSHQKFSSSSTALNILSWFGFSNDGDDKKRNDATSKEVKEGFENFGGVAGIFDSMENSKTSQQVGKRTSMVLQDLSNMLVEGSAADGKVKVVMNGQQRPMSVQIDNGYFQNVHSKKDGSEELGVALTQAMQEAHKKSCEKMEEKMKSFYSDVGL